MICRSHGPVYDNLLTHEALGDQLALAAPSPVREFVYSGNALIFSNFVQPGCSPYCVSIH